MHKRIWIAMVGAVLALSACGDTFGEQAILGGGAGAGIGLVAGVSPLGAALVGAGTNIYCQEYSGSC